MKKLLVLALLFFAPTVAHAQCTGVFPPNTSCGNFTGSPAPPSAQAIGMGTIGAGTANQIPFYLSAGTSVSATSSLPVGFDLTGGQLTHDLQRGTNTTNPNGASPVWNRLGTVINPNNSSCSRGAPNLAVDERGILYEGSPQILTQYPNVFKAWFHAGVSTNDIRYAESPDGISWTCYSGNPVIGTGNTQVHSVVKNGSTYNIYPVNTSTGSVDRYTSTNGVSWTLANSSVLSPALAWEGGSIVNPFVWMEDSTHWKMMYSGNGSGPFQIGLATSSDGITWAKSGSNPVLTTDQASGPFVYKSVGGTYYLWTEANLSNNSTPTDIYRYTSANLTSWTRSPSDTCTFCRGAFDEGAGNSAGQVADVSIVEVNGKTYMFYGALHDQSGNFSSIKLAIAPMPLEQVILTNEGDLAIKQSATQGNPYQVGAGQNGERLNLQFTANKGIVGYNMFINGAEGVKPNAASVPGFFERFLNSNNTNAGTTVTRFMLPTGGGNGEQIDGYSFTSTGDLSAYTLYGPSNPVPSLCFDPGILGVCQGSIAMKGTRSGMPRISLGIGGNPTGIAYGAAVELSQESASPGGASSEALLWNDSTAHRPKFNYNAGQDVIVTGLVGSGTIVTSGNIGPNACVTQVIPVTGALSTDVLKWTLQGPPLTSWSSTNVLTHMTSGFANLDLCNPSSSNLSPASMTVNYQVTR